MTQSPIDYRSTDITEIDLIRPLWDQLNTYHTVNARAFRDVYTNWTFSDRKDNFKKVAAAGHLRIDLAFYPVSGRYVGYCVSSFSQERGGEIESIFVEESCRLQGIGTALLTRALAWIDTNNPVRVRISVADGNEDSFAFYQRFGFHPRMTVLERI